MVGSRFFTIETGMTTTARGGTNTVLYLVIQETENEYICQVSGSEFVRSFNRSYVDHLIESGYVWSPKNN